MDKKISKYAERTRRKTKRAKLPALSTLSPILPDASAGIDSFNASFGGDSGSVSFGEDLSNRDMDDIAQEVGSECRAYMIDKGFDEEYLDDVLSVETHSYGNVFNVTVYADLTISSLRELADTLYPTISQYDDEAYFDISANNSISVDLEMKKSITEQLKHVDSMGFRRYSVDYGLQQLYESTKAKLDNNDRKKLQQFLQTTDDPEAVNTYMKGLLMEDADDFSEDADELSSSELAWIEKINDTFEELRDLMGGLVGEANRNGNDVLRSYADSALLSLDDFSDALREIEDAFDDVQKESRKPDVEHYVNLFIENYETPEEFEDATDLEWNEENIVDTVFEWVLDDVGDDLDGEDIAMDVAFEVAQRVM